MEDRKQLRLCVAMMVKNEERSILRTLESVAGIATHVRIYDTGSTDSTQQRVADFAQAHTDIDVRMRTGTFVNFAESRNELLVFCEEDAPDEYGYLLLLDSNDVLSGSDELAAYLTSFDTMQHDIRTRVGGFQIRQKWTYGSGPSDTYFNVRLIRSHCGWRYHGVVHEYIATESEQSLQVRVQDEAIVITQDRTRDCESSGARFARDYELLLAEHHAHPDESRTLFYLAQTCACLGKNDEAYYYYRLRTEITDRGFGEEVFHAHMRLGDLAKALGMQTSTIIQHYMRAMEHTPRAEPACKAAALYLFSTNPPNYHMAHMFARYATSVQFPRQCSLFVNEHDYTYTRYHLAGISAWYVDDREFGMECCRKAIAAKPDSDIDKSNLQFYTNEKSSHVSPAT